MPIPTQFAEYANHELDRGLEGLERERSAVLVLATLVSTVVSALAAAALAVSGRPLLLRALASASAIAAVGSAVSLFLNGRSLFDIDPVKRFDEATSANLNAEEFLSKLIELKIVTYLENGAILRRLRVIARVELGATVVAVVLSLALLVGR